MGDGSDKLWVEEFGRPIWRWSLDALLAVRGMETIAVVVPADALARFESALPPGATDRCRLVAGGEARADSVRAGLQALTDAGVEDATVVLIHDAARPAASSSLMEAVAEAATAAAGAIPVVPIHDTVKRLRDDMATETVDRSDLAAAQTPQAARLGILRAALDAARSQGWEPTDEAAALAAINVPIRTVPGDPANRKLTDPEDVDLLHALLRARAAPAHAPSNEGLSHDRGLARAAVGFDAHRLEPGRTLHLGGLAFPDEPRGLVGHSDGDAALHAVIDALLGAAGLGDIGTLFPPDDPAWDGANSGELLERAIRKVAEAGWAPISIDLAIAAAHPLIAPRRGELASRVGALAGLVPEAVTVRGTTSDGLGFAGSEGIAAWAVAVVERRG
jgi:2-C-methyl-D-erythritol 4-phosphate cytidylyltransferase/2-C-methyl-D-erythritol 2,4-cyclodiphosphate synthase